MGVRWGDTSFLVLHVTGTVPLHSPRLSPERLPRMIRAAVLWVGKTFKGGPGKGQEARG